MKYKFKIKILIVIYIYIFNIMINLLLLLLLKKQMKLIMKNSQLQNGVYQLRQMLLTLNGM